MRISKIGWLIIGFITCLIFLSLTSCRVFTPKQFCESRYPAVKSDSTYTKETFVWDTVYKNVPYIDISFDTSGVVDNHVEFHKVIKKDGLTGSLDISKGIIKFKVSNDSLKIQIAYLKKQLEINHSKKEVKIIHDPCDKEHKQKWNYFATYFTWIGLVLIAIGLAFKMFKKG